VSCGGDGGGWVDDRNWVGDRSWRSPSVSRKWDLEYYSGSAAGYFAPELLDMLYASPKA
jgi:hypothetical protein